MLWSCPDLKAERKQHSSLFMTPAASLAEFFQEDLPAMILHSSRCTPPQKIGLVWGPRSPLQCLAKALQHLEVSFSGATEPES